MSDAATKVHNTFRRWRKARGLTLRQVGDAMGVSYSYISKMETTKYGLLPGLKVLRRMSDVYAVPMSEILRVVGLSDEEIPDGRQTLDDVRTRFRRDQLLLDDHIDTLRNDARRFEKAYRYLYDRAAKDDRPVANALASGLTIPEVDDA